MAARNLFHQIRRIEASTGSRNIPMRRRLNYLLLQGGVGKEEELRARIEARKQASTPGSSSEASSVDPCDPCGEKKKKDPCGEKKKKDSCEKKEPCPCDKKWYEKLHVGSFLAYHQGEVNEAGEHMVVIKRQSNGIMGTGFFSSEKEMKVPASKVKESDEIVNSEDTDSEDTASDTDESSAESSKESSEESSEESKHQGWLPAVVIKKKKGDGCNHIRIQVYESKKCGCKNKWVPIKFAECDKGLAIARDDPRLAEFKCPTLSKEDMKSFKRQINKRVIKALSRRH